MTRAIDNVDDVLHQKVRLRIVHQLASKPHVSFLALKDKLHLSDGNLSTHLTILERHEYVRIEKHIVAKKPQTTIALTYLGRDAFVKYLEALERVIFEGRRVKK